MTAEGASDTETYAWSKNNVAQADPLHSGGSFTLKGGESVTVTLPQHVKITLSEENEDYVTVFRLGDGQAEKVNTKTFVLTNVETLRVVNTRNALLPTGVKTHMTLAFALLVTGLAGIGWIRMRRNAED